MLNEKNWGSLYHIKVLQEDINRAEIIIKGSVDMEGDSPQVKEFKEHMRLGYGGIIKVYQEELDMLTEVYGPAWKEDVKVMPSLKVGE